MLPHLVVVSLMQFLVLLWPSTTVSAFLPHKPVLVPSRRRPPSLYVARAETRTTSSTQFDNHASTFRQLCDLLCPKQSHLIRLDESDDGLRGVYTTQTIEAGDVILSVPLDACLRDDQVPFWMNHNNDDDNNRVLEQAAAAAAAVESNPYTASAWAKRLAASLIELQLDAMESIADEADEMWLSLLPEATHLRATLPIHWSEDIIASAHCSALELAVDSAFFARAEAVDDILLQLVDGCKAAELFSTENLRIMAENALDIVQTRTCRVESSSSSSSSSDDDEGRRPVRLLAPLFDMLNHNSLPNAAFGLEQIKEDGDSKEAYDALVVRATRDIKANSEVFISYGASTRPSWRCLASYGFVPTYDSSQPEYEEEEGEEMAHSAEVYLEGMRYEVGPGSISQELVDAMQECIDPTLPRPATLTPQVALRLAQRISEAAFQMLLDDSGTGSLDAMSQLEDDNDDDECEDADEEDEVDLALENGWSLAHVISARQAAALRWNQHRILMACSLGLRDWAAGQSAGSNM